jgi:hypothetical protein
MPSTRTFRPPIYFEHLLTDLGNHRRTTLGINVSATLGGAVFSLWGFENAPTDIESVCISFGDGNRPQPYPSIGAAAGALTQLWKNRRLPELVTLSGGRFYLQTELFNALSDKKIGRKLAQIPWLTSPNRMAAVSLASGISILFHRDFVPLEEFLADCVYRVQRRPERKRTEWESIGSCFAATQGDRLLWISAKHVIASRTTGAFRLVDRRERCFSAIVDYISPTLDFATFHVADPADHLPVLEIGRPELCAVNDPVITATYSEL